MSDGRLLAANVRVADVSLKGQVEAAQFVEPSAAQIVIPVTDLCPSPGAMRDRQLIMGDQVQVYEHLYGRAFVRSVKDGYVGYVASVSLGPVQPMTHRVCVRGTHSYPSESFKQPAHVALTFGAQVHVVAERKVYFELADGTYVPKRHLRPIDRPFQDPATIAQLFFGTPYVWGGNTSAGIDCSGLVQAALLACDIVCPADSDQQRAALGVDIKDGAPLQRDDIVFWQGHVGIMVDGETILHANAHHMAVSYEPIIGTIARIAANGFGPVLARKRLSL